MVYTNKNLARDALDLDRDWVMRWWLLQEEYSPEIVHVSGTTNTVIDDIDKSDLDAIYTIKQEFIEDIGESDYSHVWHEEIYIILSQP